VKDCIGFGILGLGAAGQRHARSLLGGHVAGARLVAVYDPNPEKLAGFSLPSAADAAAVFADPGVLAVVIATPHPSHAELARQALRAGRHVLVEKPLAVHKAEAERTLALYAALPAPRPAFGVIHDYRVDPRFVFLARLLSSGELGRVERVVWQATDWFRTDAYYRASEWRGSFEGEGGGILVNQAPHLLDTLVWLFGMPRRVLGVCRFGRFHDLEVEDDVTAHLTFASGMTALLVLGTGEAPGTNRLEISADRGRVVLEGTAAVIHRNREPASVHRRRELGGRPLADVERVELDPRPATGQLLLQDFVDAIRAGESVRVPAEQAARAVELANAILWSALEECPVELPIDGALFAQIHEKLSRGGVRRMSG
jgi:predicted dehydrogenase